MMIIGVVLTKVAVVNEVVGDGGKLILLLHYQRMEFKVF